MDFGRDTTQKNDELQQNITSLTLINPFVGVYCNFTVIFYVLKCCYTTKIHFFKI